MSDPIRRDEFMRTCAAEKMECSAAYAKWKALGNADDEAEFMEVWKRSVSEPAKPRHNRLDITTAMLRFEAQNPKPKCPKDSRHDVVATYLISGDNYDAYHIHWMCHTEGVALTPFKLINATGQKADTIPMRFIQPGLVRYADVGDVLVRKETLDRMVSTFVGKPVFNETHKEVTSRDFTSGRADGVITRVWFEPNDGWYWCEAMVWDPEAKENCRNGYSVSCAYDVLQWSDAGGVTNNIPYNREVLEGEYTHMAIVANPRYEGARILYNTQGGSMKLAFWRKEEGKPEVRNTSEVETATLEIDGQQVPLKEAIELYNSTKEKSAALDNAKLKDEDEVEVGGERVTVKNLKDAYVTARKNADEKDKKDKDDEEERKNAEAKEKEKEKDDDEERKNAEEKKKKEDEEEERKNAEASRQKLANANRDRSGGDFEAPKFLTREDRVAEGAARYGKSK